jgi:hypothetical protein
VEGDPFGEPYPARVKSSDANVELQLYEELILLVFKSFSAAYRNWHRGDLKRLKKP